MDLEEDFVLLGAVENPFPYYTQADLYVHATRFEGKSIAIQEAQILGCPVIATDCRGNREQIACGADGILCKLDTAVITQSIAVLLDDAQLRSSLGRRGAHKDHGHEDELQLV